MFYTHITPSRSLQNILVSPIELGVLEWLLPIHACTVIPSYTYSPVSNTISKATYGARITNDLAPCLVLSALQSSVRLHVFLCLLICVSRDISLWPVPTEISYDISDLYLRFSTVNIYRPEKRLQPPGSHAVGKMRFIFDQLFIHRTPQ
jgi:hypothetical protein